MFHVKHCTICTVVCCVTFPQPNLKRNVFGTLTHGRQVCIYYIIYIYGLVLCSSLVCVVCSVSMYARKPFCFVFECKSMAIIGNRNPFFGKNTQNCILKYCKVLKMKGYTPEDIFEAGHKLPIDIFYFLIFSDFYFSFFLFYYYIYQVVVDGQLN